MNLLSPLTEPARSGVAYGSAAAVRTLFRIPLGGDPITPALLSRVMTDCCGGPDASGAWHLRQAYDVCEAAGAMAFRRNADAMARRDRETLMVLANRMAGCLPLQSRRSEVQNRLSQFSTPLPLAVVAATAAHARAGELALEPSCGRRCWRHRCSRSAHGWRSTSSTQAAGGLQSLPPASRRQPMMRNSSTTCSTPHSGRSCHVSTDRPRPSCTGVFQLATPAASRQMPRASRRWYRRLCAE